MGLKTKSFAKMAAGAIVGTMVYTVKTLIVCITVYYFLKFTGLLKVLTQ